MIWEVPRLLEFSFAQQDWFSAHPDHATQVPLSLMHANEGWKVFQSARQFKRFETCYPRPKQLRGTLSLWPL